MPTAPLPPAVAPSTSRRWLLSVGMLIALLQGAIFAVIDPDLAGWHPHHGHVSIGGHVADHAHPWDRDHRHGPALLDLDQEHEAATLVFSGTAEGMAGAVTSPALPGGVALLGAPPAVLLAGATSEPGVTAFASDVPTPPPRA